MREGLKRGFETFFVNGTETCFNDFKKIQIVSIRPIFTPKKGIRTQYDEISETIGRILGLGGSQLGLIANFHEIYDFTVSNSRSTFIAIQWRSSLILMAV